MVSINGQLGLSGTIPSLPALIGRILFGLTTSKPLFLLVACIKSYCITEALYQIVYI